MKISSSSVSARYTSTNASKPTSAPTNASIPKDNVAINPRAAQLSATAASLDTVPVVDNARVESIKQAIREGSFQVNAGKIADKLLSSARDLLLPPNT